MSRHVRVGIIGGGVIGCSVLYHLTKRGWADVALFERTELTAGSTWHAAGGMHTLNGNSSVAALQKYSIEMYRDLEAIEGAFCGVHRPGCLYLASSKHQVEFFKAERTKARSLGIDLDFVDFATVRKLNPLIDTSRLAAAMYDPNDGHVDPSGVTNAMATAARIGGAKVLRHCPVTGINRRQSGEWEICTPSGDWVAEYLVNAAGLWAREVGRMFGVDLPIIPMEHQYIITDDLPELNDLRSEISVGVDFEGGNYFRQERKGLLFGAYEQQCRHWAVDGTPNDFGMELLPPDLERISDSLERAMERIPALRGAGIRKVVNGAMVFSPDGNPIIGPLERYPTAFVAAGCMAGFSQSGGVGMATANWIIDGEPGIDVFAMDVARYGDFATKPYVLAKAAENYQQRFVIPCPNEELPAARPLKTSPVYTQLLERGAVMGAAAGWEVPQWFAGCPELATELPSFRRSNSFAAVSNECIAVRTAAGLMDISAYGKIEVAGKGAPRWLDSIVANKVPDVGRIALCPMLTPRGRILGDVTVFRTHEDRMLLLGSPLAEPSYLRWLGQHRLPQIRVRSLTNDLAGFSLCGPYARQIIEHASSSELSTQRLPFMSLGQLTIGMAEVLVARLSFTGELGFELYTAHSFARHVYDTLHQVGDRFGLRDFGLRALNSLRLEKAYGSWGREFTEEHTPGEALLMRFINRDKATFIGKDAAIEEAKKISRRLSLLKVTSADADPIGGEPVLSDDRVIGRVTSGGYSHTFEHSLAFAYLPVDCVTPQCELQVELLGSRCAAVVLGAAPYDPSGQRLRA